MHKQLLVLAIAATTALASSNLWAANDDGVILAAAGQATAKGVDGTTRKLDRRSPINAGDTIITGADGKVQLRMKDGTVLALGENSEFAINQYSSKAAGDKQDGAALKLVKGTLMQVSGNMDKSAYTLQTPVSTLGIRGTVFNIKVNPDGSVTATVDQGAVVSASQSAVNSAQQAVAAAQTTFANASAKVAASQAKLEAMKANPKADPDKIAALTATVEQDQQAADAAEKAVTTANNALQDAVAANGGQLNAGQANQTNPDGTSKDTAPVTFTAATPAELARVVAANNPKDAADITSVLTKAFPSEAGPIKDAAIGAAPGEVNAINKASEGALSPSGGDTPPPPGANDPTQNPTTDTTPPDGVTNSDKPEVSQSPP